MKFASSASQCYLQFHIIGTSRYYTAVVVAKNNNRFVPQVGTKNFLAARIERIHISERKHQLVPRVLCMNAITTPNICSSSG
ncbi:hypothetical protein P853_04385 [Enterobacter hormaechei subsp. hoffmannii UCI 50]|uniref:Uncharacterized protein n=2 Tax=Enterobacter cloacae complex TaxID=354276 RepID=A0ABC9U6I6_ENTAS|nr:hypothetical protein L402_04945 [Enterobacter asburiae]EUL30050.1 hypothetical protein P853_04385 [Enterobacter hormaechei subsp. hoffmannii UCI 50]BBV94504.1 hypothetical protein STW0522ENT66_P13100 [Enterobacter roggenkampii]SAD21563.1 Uncharacterised protein [Enterobacter roggenkampii]